MKVHAKESYVLYMPNEYADRKYLEFFDDASRGIYRVESYPKYFERCYRQFVISILVYNLGTKCICIGRYKIGK